MAFSCLLITRPQAQAAELAAQLEGSGITPVLIPAHDFVACELSDADRIALARSLEQSKAGASRRHEMPLLIFTSTRSVEFGLPQIPAGAAANGQWLAIGPATGAALRQAGCEHVLQPEAGYASEDLLQLLLDSPAGQAQEAWIFAAEGGREALVQGLSGLGMQCRKLLVYERRARTPDPEAELQLQQADNILSVWTSADAMRLLSEALSPLAWSKVCAGTWLCISGRLAEQALTYQAAKVQVARGPDNLSLAADIVQLDQAG